MAVAQNRSYDLSSFEPKKKTETAADPKAVKAQNRRARWQRFLNTSAMVFVAMICLSAFVLLLTGRAQLTELENEKSRLEQELYEMQEDYKSLSNDLASKTSAQSVEEWAQTHLNMQAIESSQVEYVTVDGGDRGEVTEDTTGTWVQDVAASISKFFARIAYLFS